MDADGHAQPDVPGRCRERAHRTQRAAHFDGGAAAASGVTGSGEEQEHGIAAELQQVRALLVGGGEQPGEAAAHHLRHLFGADLALAREALGHRREAGDVHEHEGAIDLAPVGVGSLPRPFDEQAGKVRGKITAHTVLWYEMHRKSFPSGVSANDGYAGK